MVGMCLTLIFMILDLRLIRVVIKKVDWEWWDKPLISACGTYKTSRLIWPLWDSQKLHI